MYEPCWRDTFGYVHIRKKGASDSPLLFFLSSTLAVVALLVVLGRLQFGGFCLCVYAWSPNFRCANKNTCCCVGFSCHCRIF